MRGLFPLLLACSSMLSWGCSPSGTGTVDVNDRGKIAEQLSKGARPAPKGKAIDELGIKFRKKD